MVTDSISSARCDDVVFNHTVAKNFIEKDYSAHYHDRCEIILFIRGNARYVAEGRSYKLSSGDVIISRPSVIHAVFPKENAEYERINIIINEKKLSQSLWDRLKSGKDVFRCRDNERIIELFSKLDYYYGKFTEEEYSRLVFNIVEEILYNISITESVEEGKSENPLLETALEYIKENLTQISGVEQVSRALYITKSHLHHLFSKHLQLTPAKYITQKRLMLARRKLRRGEKPTAVFSDCGFEDYATFFRNYKRHFGYSPAEESKAVINRTILS